jgi:2-oxoglutarate ferredoxin oxidoreductase subunit gamma
MHIKALFAGFGGQGVLSMGNVLAYAAMLEDKHVTYFPSYGAEVRGGTANCTVAIGDEEIASPIASEPEILVAMNGPSLRTFLGRMSAGGLLLLNSSLISERPAREDVEVVGVPAVELAEESGSGRSANMVMLGALVELYGLVAPESVHAAFARLFGAKKSVVAPNARAFDRGRAFAAESKRRP